jgi:DNA-binding beta-propeller fold protein YncE
MKKIISILIVTVVLAIGAYLFFSKRIPEKQLPQANNKTSTTEIIDFHKLFAKNESENILKLFNPVIDEQNRKLYVVGTKTTSVSVIDLNKDELVDTFDIGVFGGFLIFNNQKLYSFDTSQKKCFEIDTKHKKAVEISINTCTNLTPQDRGKPRKSGEYSFLETGYRSFPDGTTGFPTDWTQNLNGAYGVIEISDSAGKKVGEIVHGPDANFFTIDFKTNKLYTTNTGDGSVSVFDLNKLKSTNFCEKNSCLIKEINVGDSADQVVADSAGSLYVRNRLGGSTIFKYNPSTKALAAIENENSRSKNLAIWNDKSQSDLALGMWPTDMALSKDEKRLYVLSHYGALIDVIDTNSNKIITKIKFNTPLKPRTDSISAMALNKLQDKLYAAWPEIGLIGIADGKEGKVLGTIDLAKYGFDSSKAANRGPGFINIAVDAKTDLLYAYFFNEQKLLVFDGTTLEKKSEVAITLKNKGENLLVVNSEGNELYLGNTIYALETLKETGHFSRGQKVQSFNSKTGAIYLSELIASSNVKFKKSLKIYEFIAGSQTKEWTIDNLGEIANTFFDFNNNTFYVADFLSGTVIKKNLAESSTSTTPSVNLPPTDARAQKPTAKTEPPIRPTQGKCGDGICQPIEKEKGVCPEDCK